MKARGRMTAPKRRTGRSIPGIRRDSIETLTRLLRRQPLPLRELVRVIVSDPALMSLVVRAAGAESASLPADPESAVVLLGADGLRALVHSAAQWAPRRNKGVLPSERRMRALRKAIGSGNYPLSTRAIAAAMLRDLERS